jgi:hypothetical protein
MWGDCEESWQHAVPVHSMHSTEPAQSPEESPCDVDAGIGIDGRSDTTCLQKWKFSMAWFAPGLATISVGYQREAYTG